MASEKQDALDDRKDAVVKALHHIHLMKYEMKKAKPGTTYDCWYMVVNSLCDIASEIVSLQEALDKSKLDGKEPYDGN